MSTKLDYYDILGILLPGVLLLCWTLVCFPDLGQLGKGSVLPTGFDVLALTVLSIFAGHVVQAVASIFEPLLYASWKGRPSDRALTEGLGNRYLPKETARRIRTKLEEAVESSATEHSIFLFAMQQAQSPKDTRASRFNSIYAYHRGLLLSLVCAIPIFAASALWGAVATWSSSLRLTTSVLLVLLTFLFWHRAKQRAYYFVRETLLTAEQVLDSTKC